MAFADPCIDTEGVELTLDARARLAPLLARRIQGLGEHSPAELSFGNLWLFRRAHRWRWHDGPWPCIGGVAYDGTRHAIPLFDPREAPRQALQGLLERHGGLAPLRDDEVPAMRALGLRIDSQRDDADYLFAGAQFRHYAGRLLQKKANLMAQLLRQHRVTAQVFGPGLQGEAIALLEAWMHEKGKAAGDADELPCREAIAMAAELGLDGFVYHADEQPAGFVLAEQLHAGVWVVRFAKGLQRFKGIAQYMFHHFASRGDQPVDWINFENDLGLPNFRQTKLSYQPVALVHKWRLLPPQPAPRPLPTQPGPETRQGNTTWH